MIGDEPTGIVGEVVLPVSAHLVTFSPDWCVGVRVHSSGNNLQAELTDHSRVALSPTSPRSFALADGHVIVRQNIASFDDSIQPTGATKWDPWPHAEMKKLHHDLVLTVEGPDEGVIRSCINKAIAAGLIAAIIAAVATGGAALGAAVSGFLAALEGCLGNSFNVRIDDNSHWEYWWS